MAAGTRYPGPLGFSKRSKWCLFGRNGRLVTHSHICSMGLCKSFTNHLGQWIRTGCWCSGLKCPMVSNSSEATDGSVLRANARSFDKVSNQDSWRPKAWHGFGRSQHVDRQWFMVPGHWRVEVRVPQVQASRGFNSSQWRSSCSGLEL